MELYSAAAQIIPVLYLAMAFETDAFNRHPSSYVDEPDDPAHWNATQIIGRVYVVVLMALGEVAALIGLHLEEQHGAIDGFVWLALTAGMIGVLAPPLARQLSYWRAWRAHYDRSAVWSLVYIMGLPLIGLTLLAVTSFE